jgi:hypothetical protein
MTSLHALSPIPYILPNAANVRQANNSPLAITANPGFSGSPEGTTQAAFLIA